MPAPSTVGAGLPTGRGGLRFPLVMVVALGLLVTASIASLLVGAVSVPPGQVFGVIGGHLLPGAGPGEWSAVTDRIVWQYRLPRTLLAILVGAGLAVVGTVLQAVVRNPLADPFLLGASSGASFGAVLVIVSGTALGGALTLSGAAFLGALTAMALVYLLARTGGMLTPGRLVLAGVALAYLFQAGYAYVLQKADAARAAQAALFWLLGSLAGARWDTLALPAVVLAAGIGLLMLRWRMLNAVSVGEEFAVSLGVAAHRLRAQMFVVTSLLTGVLVAVTGAVAFVGLIVPHTARLLVGADHRRLLPVSAVLGAGFLQAVDIAARLLDAPQELPLSVVTAVFGVPFFLWLLRRRDADGVVS
ncbi:iron ABC transporter permease [Micromonospora sp. KC723]|uniref:FecCD family ABC transporter permease n=1 Tax=Micromonospora sp. KC723 TaxID=2530381 RepID=UPI00104E4A41|nr:iron ABC transporter permease [Micromonospora sp. KC723]TDB76947.1 iron ABC transporter permease [Micromonospora sp. KC723]